MVRPNALMAVVWMGCARNAEPDAPTDTDPATETDDSGVADTDDTDLEATLIPWIDTHAHPLGIHGTCTTADCLDGSVAAMDQFGVASAFLLHPPAPILDQSAEQVIRDAVATHPDRFWLGSGGNVINATIQQTPDSGEVSESLHDQLVAQTQGLLAGGDPVVFGEITALHLSYEEGHAYEETLPNTPLFLHLADLAAANGVPIDLHMDAVIDTMATPTWFLEASDNNPEQIQGNVGPLEELLDHNPDAKIVWVHVGRDTTGDMSAALIDPLMSAHDNLYIQLHPVFGPLGSATAIVDSAGNIRPEWLTVLETYPDRIVLGSDTFFAGTEDDGEVLEHIQGFLHQLPAELATAIGCVNPVALYGLSYGC